MGVGVGVFVGVGEEVGMAVAVGGGVGAGADWQPAESSRLTAVSSRKKAENRGRSMFPLRERWAEKHLGASTGKIIQPLGEVWGQVAAGARNVKAFM